MDVVVIGGGIVGLATALELVTRFRSLSLLLLEKESALATHQTGHNSGVIHSGIYYKPGSFKAMLCVEGYTRLINFCRQHTIPFELCGKVIVATEEKELPRLEELYRRGLGNGLDGLRLLTAAEIRQIEPNAAGIRGIHVPGTGIVDYATVCQKIAALVTSLGGSIRLSCEVTSLGPSAERTIVQTATGSISARLVINCAGLQSDRVSRMAKAQLDMMIIPFRGEYYDLAPGRCHLVNGLIYPVPDPELPFLGVHFTKRVAGGVEAGPNAVLAFKREGYRGTSFRASDVLEFATFPGFWKLAAAHWKTSLDESYRSLSKDAFVKSLQKLMPAITRDDLIPGGSGVRAQAVTKTGKLVDDFHFAYSAGMVHVCNVPSPAATASFAIARHIVDTIVSHPQLKLSNPTFTPL